MIGFFIADNIFAINSAIHKQHIESGIDFICVAVMIYFTIDLIKAYIGRKGNKPIC